MPINLECWWRCIESFQTGEENREYFIQQLPLSPAFWVHRYSILSPLSEAEVCPALGPLSFWSRISHLSKIRPIVEGRPRPEDTCDQFDDWYHHINEVKDFNKNRSLLFWLFEVIRIARSPMFVTMFVKWRDDFHLDLWIPFTHCGKA